MIDIKPKVFNILNLSSQNSFIEKLHVSEPIENCTIFKKVAEQSFDLYRDSIIEQIKFSLIK